MRDAVQLEGMTLIKGSEEHKVLGLFVTGLGSTYIKVFSCAEEIETNYEYRNFSRFLKKYKFSVKPGKRFFE